MKLGTAFGAFLDPVADKLMVAAALILLCSRPLEVAMSGEVPWLFTVPATAIIGREITMSAVREWAASRNSKLLEAVAVNNLGKWKTATQMISLTILLAARDSSLEGPGILVPSGVILLYISAGLSVWSLAVYVNKELVLFLLSFMALAFRNLAVFLEVRSKVKRREGCFEDVSSDELLK
ncbi:hypothetical protein D5086_020760 [Populus alba]|uniref:Uncharacterized protein n=1 Tax=Populus alba TaxID=43335 RepID=A0ACC4BLM7_POPAL